MPLFSGCVHDPCLEIDKLNKYSNSTKEWFVNDTIDNPTFVDENGISQTLIVSSLYSYSYDQVIEDDCGNTFGSFDFSIQYNTSMSPIHFSIDIHGSGLIEDGFYLKLQYSNNRNNTQKTTFYDFVTKKNRDHIATTKYIEQTEVNNRAYYDVLKIKFNNVETDSEVNLVYFAKGVGIIKFASLNGNSYGIQY